MFPRALNQRSNLKKRLFCSNQCIFTCRLPIIFFYFEDFRWSFFGKFIGQKQRIALPRITLVAITNIFIKNIKTRDKSQH